MQQSRPLPARRLICYGLVLYVIGLTGCGGGGGSSAPVPPVTNPIGGGAVLDQGSAGSLFDTIDGEGEAWLSLVDADSGFFHLNGEDPNTNDILDKIPDPDPNRTITRQYSRLSYIPPSSINPHDPGRYLLYGRLANTNLAGLQDLTLRYDLRGHWTCAGCRDVLPVIHGNLEGGLNIDINTETAVLNLIGHDIDISADLSLAKNGVLDHAENVQVSFDGSDLNIIRSRIMGGLYGDHADEAGILFGLTDSRGWVFSGGASGEQSD